MNEFEVNIHERITERHPEITEDDVRSAFGNMIRCRQRATGEFVAVGSDSNSRMLELVYVQNFFDNSFLVYHAQTPPTKKTIDELDFK